MEENRGRSDGRCALTSELAISDATAAREVSTMMLEFGSRLEQSTELVHSSCSVEEWKAYKRAAATIYADMFIYVLEPLYKEHPSLKPPEWDA
jgi:hypothetical protein